VQQLRFQGDEVRVGRVARALERHREHGLHMRRALREHIDSISKREGLFDVMGDKERRLGELLSGFEEPCVQLARVRASSAPKGSSSNSISLWERSVRMSATRWRIPAESCAG